MNSKEVIQEIRTLLGFSTEEPQSEVQFAEATLSDGTQIKWEGDLMVGTAITVVTAEGEIPAPDGTHEMEDGTLITTVGGVVSDLVSPSPEVEVEMEVSQEFATVEKFNEVVSSLENKIAELTLQFERVVSQLEKQSNAFSKTVDLVEKVANLPAEVPTVTPETMSKKESKFAQITKIAQQLKTK